MSESVVTRKAGERTAPKAGEVSVYAGSTTAATQNLALCGPVTLNMSNADVYPNSIATGTSGGGLLDRYGDFYADGVDVGLVFGPSSASVSGNNAPNLSVTGTDTTGSNGSCCVRIPSGTSLPFFIHTSTLWVGYVASSNAGFLRIYPSSR